MRTLLTILLVAGLSFGAVAGDGYDKLFAKYAGSDEITSVNLTSKMIGFVSNFLDEGDKAAKELLANIESVKVLAAEGKGNDQLAKEAMGLIKSGDYEELIRVNDPDGNVRIVVDENSKGVIKEVIIFAEGDGEIAFIDIKGDIDPEKVGEVLRTLDIDMDVDIDFDE